MTCIGSRRVFATEIRIVQVVTQLTDGQRREIYHCRTGRTYCYGPELAIT